MGRLLVCFLCCFSVLVLAQESQLSAKASFADEDYVGMIDDLDLNKRTALYVDTQWKSFKGKEVTWTGKVVNAQKSRNSAEIFLAKSEKMTYKGYNIIVKTFDQQGAGNLLVGQTITIKGRLSDYKNKKGNPILIYLGEGQIVEVKKTE